LTSYLTNIDVTPS